MTPKQKQIILLLFYLSLITMVLVGFWDVAPEIKYTISWIKEILK